MVAAMTVEEPTDTDIFLAYLDHCLCPALRPGDVVVMDSPKRTQGSGHTRSHRGHGSRTAVPATVFARPEPD